MHEYDAFKSVFVCFWLFIGLLKDALSAVLLSLSVFTEKELFALLMLRRVTQLNLTWRDVA